MSDKHEGPIVQIKSSCWQCKHHESVRYRVQGDSGYDKYCNLSAEQRNLPDDSVTPDWCPFVVDAIKAKIAEYSI